MRTPLSTDPSSLSITPLDRAAADPQIIRVQPQRPIAIDSNDQEALLSRFDHQWTGFPFSWNYLTFLKFLVPYFSKTFKGTRIVQTKGTFFSLGKPFWEKVLQGESAQGINWSFCTERPRGFDLWVCVEPEHFQPELFQQLVIQFLAVQGLVEPPRTLRDALMQKGACQEQIAALGPHLRMFRGWSEEAKSTLAIVEVFSQQVSLRVVFTYTSELPSPFLIDDFRLEIFPFHDTIAARLICPSAGGREALYDRCIHRLAPTSSSLNAMALGSYWVHLTLGGAVFEGGELERRLMDAASLDQKVLVNAFYECKRDLSIGKEAVLAYWLNTLQFLYRHKILIRLDITYDLIGEEPLSPLGEFLISTPFPHSMMTLQVIGSLQAGLEIPDAPKCRRVEANGELEISWNGLHLVLPFEFDQALEQTVRWLKEDEPRCLNALSKALDVFLPSFSQISDPIIQRGSDARLEEIYRALRKQHEPNLTSARFLFLLFRSGWKSIESEFLELPERLALAAEQGALKLTLVCLRCCFENTGYRTLFNEIEQRVLESLPTACRSAAMRPLLGSKEVKIFSPAWSRFAALFPDDQAQGGAELLRDCAPALGIDALPIALGRVCSYCHPGNTSLLPSERFKLLSIYLERLRLSEFEHLLASYGPRLQELLQGLLTCTRIEDPEAIAQEIQRQIDRLRGEIPQARLSLDRWWSDFFKLKQIIEAQGALETYQGELEGLSQSLYMSLLTLETAGLLMDDWVKRFADLKEQKLGSAASSLFNLLMSAPNDQGLWSKFCSLLKELEGEDLFLEEAIAMLEALALPSFLTSHNINDPPFRCFEVAIPRIGRRLTGDQKLRVARAYGAVIPLGREEEILKALPSLEWLLSMLKREELWQEFARVFLHTSIQRGSAYVSKMGPAMGQEAAWVAERLLALPQSPLFGQLTTLVLMIPTRYLHAATWKPLLAGLIARDPSVRSLFNPLLALANEREKEFFYWCKRGSVEEMSSRLTAYQRSGLPSEEEEIEKAIEGKDLELALTLLEKLPTKNDPLWMKFLECLRDDSAAELLENGWRVWVKKHPIREFQAADEKYWKPAMNRLLRKMSSQSPVFTSFLTEQAANQIGCLEKDACAVMTTMCLEMGIILCWDDSSKNITKILQVLQKMINDRLVKRKVANPIGSLSLQYRAYLHLLFANQKEESLWRDGEAWFRDYILKCDPLVNPIVFSAFSVIPFVPRTPGTQEGVFQWIKNSWGVSGKTLSWDSTFLLLRRCCQFNFEKFTLSLSTDVFPPLGGMWDHLLAELPKRVQADPVGISRLFFQVSESIMSSAMRLFNDSLSKAQIMHTFRLHFVANGAKVLSEEACANFRMHYCCAIFSLADFANPKISLTLQLALEDLESSLPYLKDHSDQYCKNGIAAFYKSLPFMLNTADPALIPLIGRICDSLMQISWVMDANDNDPFCWENLLIALGMGINYAGMERRDLAVRTSYRVFMNCTHPLLVREKTGREDNESIIKTSCSVFASLFMTLPACDCLTSTEWGTFIQGLAPKSVTEMVLQLAEPGDNVKGERLLSFNGALARLIRYAKPNGEEFLSSMEKYCLLKTIVPLNHIDPAYDIFLQFNIRGQWIAAISSIEKSCKAVQKQIPPVLSELKKFLASMLIKEIFSWVNNKDSFKIYMRLILDAIGNDPEVAQAISDAFVIPEGLSEEVQGLFVNFKAFIEKKTKTPEKTV